MNFEMWIFNLSIDPVNRFECPPLKVKELRDLLKFLCFEIIRFLFEHNH
jgi:hypothetical protein